VRLRILFIISLIAFFLFACEKEKDEPVPKPSVASGKAVYILNEGNFRSANSSISTYYPEASELFHDRYSAANQGVPLGDVAQSMSKINGRYWIVVNNSSKIEVLDSRNHQAIGRVSGLNSPRYCILGPDQKVYVSDLYQDAIYVVDANSYSISKQIPSLGWTEEMRIVGDSLFVCQVDSSQILVINMQTDSIVDRIPTAKSPLSMELDQNGKLWLGCSGGINDQEAALMKIDPKSLNVELNLRVADVSKSIGDLAMSPTADELYFLMDGVYRMDVNARSLPASAFLSDPSANFYAMDVDPYSGDLYLSDAIDYQQNGLIQRFDANGSELDQFKSGLIPGFFYFEAGL